MINRWTQKTDIKQTALICGYLEVSDAYNGNDISSKILRYASYFELSSLCFEI